MATLEDPARLGFVRGGRFQLVPWGLEKPFTLYSKFFPVHFCPASVIFEDS